MITADLVSYIRKQLENDVSSDLIVSKLEKVGWLREDIDEGFEKVREQKEREDRITQNTPVKKNNEDSSSIEPSLGDRYREPIDLDAEPLAKKEIPVIEKKKNIIDDKTKIEVNIGISDSKMELAKNEIKTEDKPVLVENNLTEKRTEIISEPKEPVVESILDDKEIEAPRREDKIWLPKNIPIKEISARDDNEKDQIVVQNIELPQASKEEKADLALVKEEIRPVEIKMEETAPIVKVDEINLINREAQSLLDAQAEVMRSKITGNISEDIKELPKEEKELPKNYNLENLPKIASISTYPNDMINAVNQIEQSGGVIKKPVNKKMIKWLIVIFVVVILGGLSAWLIMTGQINLKNINIPFINKDPRALILDNSKILSSLNSYKTETVIELTTPSFASLSAGLLTGEAVSSLDKDNLTLTSMSVISQKNNKFISDNSINIRGSILENDIDSSIKNDGQFLYVDVPDLSKVFKESTPLPASVKLTEDEFTLVPSLFGPKIENILNKVNLYRLLSSGISSYIDSNTLGSYDELINSVEITNKGEENIRGVGTYHYTINPDKQLFKNLLTKIVEKFAGRLSDIDYENLKMIISSTSVSSFDVWVGKGDNTIYQYNIKLDVPMTKILGFEDKSIGDNTLGVSLKVTYFDFNVPNEIISPEGYIDANEFVKNTKVERMKEKVQSFSILANNLQKVEKKYGAISNAKGSCMAPVSQSLFSPTGHPKASILQVSDISSLLNDILGVTNGIGSCYSTPTAWSFAIPLSDNYDPTYNVESYSSFYCVDNKGSDSILTSLPSSVSCQTPTAN